MSHSKEAIEAYIAGMPLEADGLPPADADADILDAALDAGMLDKASHRLWIRKAMAALEQARDSARAFVSKPCPITEAQFAQHAPELALKIFDQPFKTLKKYGKPRVNPKTGQTSGGAFRSGAFGYWAGGRVTLTIDGKDVDFQGTLTLTAVNSGSKAEPVESE